MSEHATIAGGCLCGTVRFRVRTPTLFCAHCHCSMCRRNHGAGRAPWVTVCDDLPRLGGATGMELLGPEETS